MAKCAGKGCSRDIPEGEKYCPACKEKADHKIKFWVKVGGGIVLLVGVVIALFKGKDE